MLRNMKRADGERASALAFMCKNVAQGKELEYNIYLYEWGGCDFMLKGRPPNIFLENSFLHIGELVDSHRWLGAWQTSFGCRVMPCGE
jgi:hypothetical protein